MEALLKVSVGAESLDCSVEELRGESQDHFRTTLTSSHLLSPPAGCFKLTSSIFFTLPASLPTHAFPSSSGVMHLQQLKRCRHCATQSVSLIANCCNEL